MRLKSVELVGFKSFFNPTQISFAPGITAVVGPNGCGKSNVVDAIRWVLGEQSPGRLRAKSLEDLIFAGSERRPPAGMAQVTLVLETDPALSPFPAPFQTYSEVSVVRRLYRSGESEYLINKVPCRLRDISEFFMALGIHSRAYAIIPQGKVEEIIQSKPPDLRALIEEAAGLTLFKERRDLSERKLARVKDNLAQLDQVLSEVERQLAVARRQAKRAQTYKVLKQEKLELERLCAFRRILMTEAELKHSKEEDARISGELEQARAIESELAATVSQISTALSELENEIQARSREVEAITASASERERSWKLLLNRLSELQQLEPTLASQLEELRRRLTSAEANRDRVIHELNQVRQTTISDPAQLDELRRQYREACEQLKQIENAAEELKDEISELMRQGTVVRVEISELNRQQTELCGRLPELEREIDTAGKAVLNAQEELSRAEKERDEIQLRIQEVEKRLRAELENEEVANREFRKAELSLASAREQLDAAVSRARRLELDVTEQRLQRVLKELNYDTGASPLRLVADVIRAPVHLETALVAVLGELTRAVIVDSHEFVLRTVEVLKKNDGGRLCFVPKNLISPSKSAPESSTTFGSERLLDRLCVEQEYADLAEALLGDVRLIENVETALADGLTGNGVVYVTPHGDIVRPGGIVSSGGHVKLERHGAVETPLSVSQARELMEAKEREKQSARQALDDARRARQKTEAELKELRNLLERAEAKVAKTRAALNRALQDRALLAERRQEIEKRLTQINARIPELERKAQELTCSEHRKRDQLAELKTTLSSRKDSTEALANRLRAIEAEIHAHQERCRGLEAQLKQAELLVAEIRGQIVEHERRLERIRKERDELTLECQRLDSIRNEAQSRQLELKARLEELLVRRQSLEKELGSARGKLAEARSSVHRVEEKLRELELKRERAQAVLSELTRNFVAQFKVDLEEVRQELFCALDGRDFEADSRRLDELNAQLDRLGAVNLEAEQDVAQLSERAESLRSERADLAKAADDLIATIDKLNREASRRFSSTFEATAQNFADIVPKLLGGGRGRLEVVEVVEGGEKGLSVLVQPPGKRIKELSLLSGGEKALSALALILSIFMLNPSPFCLLDEVDASLDERSLQVFMDFLGSLKGQAQFILVTHNQLTMRQADQIYGVTMSEPGISQILSLKLAEAA